MLGPKIKPWRSEKYRRYVAGFPCFGCGLEGSSQCAHMNAGKGRGTKVSDALTFPLCCTRPMRVGCHVQHDLLIDMTLDERKAAELRYVAKMQTTALADGWFKESKAA